MAGLRKFALHEIYINRFESEKILRFFFPTTKFTINQMTDEYRGFAQGLLVEALDASYKLGFVEIIMNTALYKVPTGFDQIASIIQSMAKKSVFQWFKYRKRSEKLEDAKIYEMVRITVSRNFRSVFEIGLATDDLSY